jgi:hypothetical protein
MCKDGQLLACALGPSHRCGISTRWCGDETVYARDGTGISRPSAVSSPCYIPSHLCASYPLIPASSRNSVTCIRCEVNGWVQLCGSAVACVCLRIWRDHSMHCYSLPSSFSTPLRMSTFWGFVATCSGVSPALFGSLSLAPALSRSVRAGTESLLLALIAKCRAVFPSSSLQ